MKINLAFLSYEGIDSIIRTLQKDYLPDVSFSVYNTVTPVDVALDLQRKGEYILISSGMNMKALKEDNRVILPTVEVKPSTQDILQAISVASKAGKKVAVFLLKGKILNFDKIKSLLKADPLIIQIEKYEEIPPILQKIKADGITGVVGTSIVCDYGKKAGMEGYLIWSTAAVRTAIDEAINLAKTNRQVLINNRILKEIIGVAYRGIVCVDKDGVIRLFNPVVAKTIGISEDDAIGKKISDVIPELSIDQILLTDEPEMDQIKDIRGHEHLLNIIPIDNDEMGIKAIIALQNTKSIQRPEEKIRRNIDQKGFVADTQFKDILGTSAEIRYVKSMASRYARTNSAILIRSETGTGKDLFAQSIHNDSSRSKRPFVAVNCAAVPFNLMESELFGYEEGAFTGAKKGGKMGLFEMAHGGTLFLDEIGEISLPIQSRLLRVLEKQEIMRVGGERLRKVDVRIITATNIDLWDMVQKKKFRDDLYYRLNVLELYIPPLRDRREDIPTLAYHFLSEMANGIPQDEIRKISESPLLTTYRWPGNVRELKNIMERLCVMYEGENSIQEILSRALLIKNESDEQSPEALLLEKTLQDCKGNRTRTAEVLGVSRTTLWRMMKEKGLG